MSASARTGPSGPTGPGVPAGGAAGQVPVKQSTADYDVAWEDQQAGEVTQAELDAEAAARAAADSAEATARAAADTTHAADTTNVHGIPDTAKVVRASAPFEIDLAGADGTKFVRDDGTVHSVESGGAVDSVNGQTGVVVLDAGDVGADPVGSAAAAQAASQPVDSDLTAIAALSTTSFGRALLALANAAAGRTAFGLGTAATAATGDFDAAGAAAAAQAASQPLDSDLTAIAALSTTSYGRALLALADASAARTALGLGSAATSASTDFQPTDSDLTAIAALTTTSYGRAFLALADAAAARTALGLGTAATSATGDFDAAGAAAAAQAASQPLDSDLTALAALSTTSFGRSLLTQADAAATRSTLGLGTAATSASTAFDAAGAAAAAQAASQPLDSDLTAIAALSTTTYGRSLLEAANAAGAKTLLALVKGDVGLGNVDNTSDANKPVSTAQQTALDLKAQGLTRTAVKTANYTAAAGDYVPVDTTSGSVTVTLPTAPASKSRVGVKQILRGGTNTVTVSCGGSDTINRTSGSTSLTLTLLAEGALLQYDSSSATWTVEANDAPLSQLDARYAVLASPAFTGTPTVPTAAQGTNTTQAASTAYVQTEAGLLVPKSQVDAKGDLLVGTADNTVARKAVGADGAALVGDSASSDGLAYANHWLGVETSRHLNSNWSATTTAAQAAGALVVGGLVVPKRQTFDRIAIEITTLAAALSVMRLLIYADNGSGKPGALVLDAGTVDTTSTGVKSATISQSLAAGVYWVGFLAENSSGNVSMRVAASSAAGPARMANSSTSAGALGADFGWFRSGITIGSPPNPFGTPGGVTTNAPFMWLRAA